MTLEQLAAILDGIPGFSGKVAITAFPEGEAPPLPYIVYLAQSEDPFLADDCNYYTRSNVQVELYTNTRDIPTERLLENAIAAAGIPWRKEIDYLSSERCYMITYSIQI